MGVPRLNTLILKVVANCNLACRCCCDDDPAATKVKLDLETGKRTIEQALEASGEGLRIIFHGGEPLLAFAELREWTFFAKATSAKLGKQLVLQLQTNGTCFTPERIRFLVDEHFIIGVSLDGPAEFNDLVRIDYKGIGCHARVLEAFRRYPELRERYGMLATITRFNAPHIDEVAAYFRDLGVSVIGMSYFLARGRTSTCSNQLSPVADELVAAHLRLLDAVENGEFDGVTIHPFIYYIRNVLSSKRLSGCVRNGGCLAARGLVSVRPNGIIESCGCVYDASLYMGNVKHSTISLSLQGDVAARIRMRSERSLPQCSSCEVRAFCGGTCFATAGGLDRVNQQECQIALTLVDPEIPTKVL